MTLCTSQLRSASTLATRWRVLRLVPQKWRQHYQPSEPVDASPVYLMSQNNPFVTLLPLEVCPDHLPVVAAGPLSQQTSGGRTLLSRGGQQPGNAWCPQVPPSCCW